MTFLFHRFTAACRWRHIESSPCFVLVESLKTLRIRDCAHSHPLALARSLTSRRRHIEERSFPFRSQIPILSIHTLTIVPRRSSCRSSTPAAAWRAVDGGGASTTQSPAASVQTRTTLPLQYQLPGQRYRFQNPLPAPTFRRRHQPSQIGATPTSPSSTMSTL